jgi:hypothetical protein
MTPPTFVNKRAFEALNTVISEKNQGTNNSKEKTVFCYDDSFAKLVLWKDCNRCGKCAERYEWVATRIEQYCSYCMNAQAEQLRPQTIDSTENHMC